MTLYGFRCLPGGRLGNYARECSIVPRAPFRRAPQTPHEAVR